MTRSMTGYGRAEIEHKGVKFSCEVLSVNRRSLEMAASFPRELAFLEPSVKKEISKACVRGQVHLRLQFEELSSTKISFETLSEIEKELSSAAAKLGDYTVSFDTIVQVALREPIGSKVARIESVENEVLEGFLEAIASWVAVKKEEGARLSEDLAKQLSKVKAGLKEIEQVPRVSVKKLQERLSKKLEEVATISSTDETRVQKELVMFADKCDTTEEIVRMLSHVEQFEKLLHNDEQSKGKEMEFLLQEMMREMTTLTSKSVDPPMTYKALNVKSYLERMRQQVLNIE